MKGMDILQDLNGIRDSYIAAAGEFRQRKAGRLPRKKALLIAAVIAMILLLTACAAAVYLTLQEMKFDEDVWSGEIRGNGTAQQVEIPRDVMGLYGSADSTIQLAAKEWYDFTQSYDPEWNLRENFPDIPLKYTQVYSCFNQEMADKLDEIAGKYNLKLLDSLIVAEPNQMEIGLEGSGIQGIFKPEANVDTQRYGIALFAPGNAQFEFFFSLTGEDALWKERVSMTEELHRKDYMPRQVEYLIPQGNREEWPYTTSDGTQLLLVLDQYGGGLIVADMPDATITINLDFIWEYDFFDPQELPTRAVLEQFAELFDYQIRPNVTDPEGLKAKIQAAEEAELEALLRSYPSYSGYADYLERQAVYLKNSFYAFFDLDGDGQEELLLSDDGDEFEAALTVVNGEAFWGFVGGRISLLENGGHIVYDTMLNIGEILYNAMNKSYTFTVSRESGKLLRWEYMPLAGVMQAFYDGDTILDSVSLVDGQWYRGVGERLSDLTPVTEEEAQAVIAKYPVKQLAWKPIQEYRLEDGRTIEQMLKQMDVRLSEAELREKYAEEVRRAPDGIQYYRLLDINGDGVKDLLLSEDGEIYSNAKTWRYSRIFALDSSFYLCENGVLGYDADNPYINVWETVHEYNYYRLDQDRRRMELDDLVYHPTTDSWSRDAYGKEPLTTEETQDVLAKYPRIDQGMRPISELIG